MPIPRMPWEGDRLCPGATNSGQPCGRHEIEGLVFCFAHVPDEDLEEAEEITGLRRCRGNGHGCKAFAVEGTNPPSCVRHGGIRATKHAAANVIEGRAMDRLAAILAEGGEALLSPPALSDPLAEMLSLAGEIKALKEILRHVVGEVMKKNQIRYSSKVGEQLRMEVLLYERATERLARILIDISKMKIDDRLAGIREQTADMLERALDMALEESGIGLDRKQAAKEVYRRHLKIVA